MKLDDLTALGCDCDQCSTIGRRAFNIATAWSRGHCVAVKVSLPALPAPSLFAIAYALGRRSMISPGQAARLFHLMAADHRGYLPAPANDVDVAGLN